MEQTIWLNDALHPGTGLRCCMSMLVMQMQHSLETITSPTRQCGSPQATKLGSKVSGVALAYSFSCSHIEHCHCSLSDHVISSGSGVNVHLTQVTGSSEEISWRAFCFRSNSSFSYAEILSSRTLRLSSLLVACSSTSAPTRMVTPLQLRW